MKISTQTAGLARVFGDTGAVRMLCEAGYDCLDYSMFYKQNDRLPVEGEGFMEHCRLLRELADSYGVTFNQTHAPFASYIEGDDAYNEWVKPLIIRSIEASGILGAGNIIIHPFSVSKNQKKANIDFFNSLLPHAQKANVRIALENMFCWSEKNRRLEKNVCSDGPEFCDYIDSLDREYFTACLDVGHCGLVGEDASEMIRQLGGERLKCLHVHDNDMIEDRHTLPYMGKLDFDKITKALKDIGYDGEMTLEADNFLVGFPDELMKGAAVLMQWTARHLASLCEK
ncbi:MAG: sugar phosphate isomerase/epimerase family protein [Clostridia bacterium]